MTATLESFWLNVIQVSLDVALILLVKDEYVAES